MTWGMKRHEQLTRAVESVESGAAPRITTEQEANGVIRVDVADTAAVRRGNPVEQQ